METITFTETVHSAGRLDKANSSLRGVKILGTQSRNSRIYTKQSWRDAAPLYEGVRVNVDHPERGKEASSRSYADRFGQIRNVQVREDGLYGDLFFNPKHAIAEQFMWDAENAPENVGLSHNADGRGRNQGGKFIVEAITRVRSVDIVADPATTSSLFESEGNPQPQPPAGPATATEFLESIAARPSGGVHFATRETVTPCDGPHRLGWLEGDDRDDHKDFLSSIS